MTVLAVTLNSVDVLVRVLLDPSVMVRVKVVEVEVDITVVVVVAAVEVSWAQASCAVNSKSITDGVRARNFHILHCRIPGFSGTETCWLTSMGTMAWRRNAINARTVHGSFERTS
jgi:hypothetical protein